MAPALLFAEFGLAQITWTALPTPPGPPVAYDSVRDRLVAYDANYLTSEFDGVAWYSLATPVAPSNWGAGGFDPSRGRVVLMEAAAGGIATWEWDGANWQQIGPVNSVVGMSDTGSLSYHAALGGLVSVYQGGAALELYLWDGQSWSLLPGQNAPPAVLWNSYYGYHSHTYDPIRDRLVVFGQVHANSIQVLSNTPTTFEWDQVNGWVQAGTSGSILRVSSIWFDEARGEVLRFDGDSGSTRAAYAYGGNGNWASLGSAGTPILVVPVYDAVNNRLYARDTHLPGTFGYFEDVFPAKYMSHRPGCQLGSPPSLELTEPWTRAWIGETMSIDLTNLSSPIGILTMGFDDQAYNGNPLPLALASYGMPACQLNVAPAASVLLAATNGRATVQIPVPPVMALVGTTFFQQVFGPSAGANPLGMVAGPSMQGTIGKSR
ncbi:MAG: hypothetical protein KDE27_26660 [Planctomycetes bacterium]|nr:hypothetical protein [Planctomycetota bacterium]